MIREELPEPQLQLWDAKARAYVPAASIDAPRGKAWRIVRRIWPLKPRLYSVPHYSASARTVQDVQTDYLRWATEKGLTQVTAFNGRPLWYYDRKPARIIEPWGGTIRYVDADDYFKVTEELDA